MLLGVQYSHCICPAGYVPKTQSLMGSVSQKALNLLNLRSNVTALTKSSKFAVSLLCPCINLH